MFSNSEFGQALENQSLPLPSSCPLPGTTPTSLPLPFVFVADEAFPLKENLLRPYPGKYLPEDQAIYNYRLSRARRIIENSFGILAARWRVFRRPICAEPNKAVLFSSGSTQLFEDHRVKYLPPTRIYRWGRWCWKHHKWWMERRGALQRT